MVVNDSILTQPSVVSLLAKARSIAGFFNHSTTALHALHQVQKELNVTELNLIQDVKTRWNSSYLMLNRIKDIESSLITFSARDMSAKCESFTGSEWNLIRKLTGILEVFHGATEQFSSKEASIAVIIPTIHEIQVWF